MNKRAGTAATIAALIASGCSTPPSKNVDNSRSGIVQTMEDEKIKALIDVVKNPGISGIETFLSAHPEYENIINQPTKRHGISEAGYRPITALDAVILTASDDMIDRVKSLKNFGAAPSLQTFEFLDKIIKRGDIELKSYKQKGELNSDMAAYARSIDDMKLVRKALGEQFPELADLSNGRAHSK